MLGFGFSRFLGSGFRIAHSHWAGTASLGALRFGFLVPGFGA